MRLLNSKKTWKKAGIQTLSSVQNGGLEILRLQPYDLLL